MSEKNPLYWKVKAFACAVPLAEKEAADHVAAAKGRLAHALTEAGCDPAKHYDLNDSDETITEKASA